MLQVSKLYYKSYGEVKDTLYSHKTPQLSIVAILEKKRKLSALPGRGGGGGGEGTHMNVMGDFGLLKICLKDTRMLFCGCFFILD